MALVLISVSSRIGRTVWQWHHVDKHSVTRTLMRYASSRASSHYLCPFEFSDFLNIVCLYAAYGLFVSGAVMPQ